MGQGRSRQRHAAVHFLLRRHSPSLRPQRPVAIQKAFTGLLAIPGFALTFGPTKVELARSGDLAYETGDDEFTIVMRERWSRRARRLACPAEQSSVALAFGRRKACVVRTLLSARPCRKAFHPGVVVVGESSNACQAPLGCLPHRTTYLALVVWGFASLSMASGVLPSPREAFAPLVRLAVVSRPDFVDAFEKRIGPFVKGCFVDI